MPTDKTGKLAVVSWEVYEKMGKAHTENEKDIDFHNMRQIEVI